LPPKMPPVEIFFALAVMEDFQREQKEEFYDGE
jgi:hypothetical protein